MNTTSGSGMAGFGIWLAGWLLFFVGMYMLSRSKAGAAIVYYILWLAVVLLLVSHYADITTVFQTANITQGQY